jgi:hypothetical protein
MLNRRGYNTDKIVECEDVNRFVVDDKVYVNIVENVKITNDVIKVILTSAKTVDKIIIVHVKALTSEAKNTVMSAELKIETFTFDEMSFDIMAIVPRHSILRDNTMKELHKFPIILKSDPVVRYFAFNKNDIILIEDGDYLSMRRVQ